MLKARSGRVMANLGQLGRNRLGNQPFAPNGADHTYRSLLEAMNQGAVTLKRGIISYCNSHFVKMAQQPVEKILGSPIHKLIQCNDLQRLLRRMQQGDVAQATIETTLCASDGARIPVLVSAASFDAGGQKALGLIVRDLTDRKQAQRARLELSRRIINAQEQERHRLAGELHDSVNQILASSKYRLNAILARRDRRCCSRSVRQVRDMIEKAIGEVRLISRNLRPSELDDLGVMSALRSLTHDFHARCGIKAQFKGEVKAFPAAVPAEMGMALYRIAQEALNNVEKHSKATRADLLLRCSDGHILLTVGDNGKGFVPRAGLSRKTGWGLENMRERARLLGGTVEIISVPRNGTRISVKVPFARTIIDGEEAAA